MAFAKPKENIKAIHEDQELCEYLLKDIKTKIPLQILPSVIHHNGSGLFTKKKIMEGTRIFRSRPLVSCISSGNHKEVCDYCLVTTMSNVHPKGRLLSIGDQVKIALCEGCKSCGYCSTVSDEI